MKQQKQQTRTQTTIVGKTIVDVFSDGNVDVWYRGYPVARVDYVTRRNVDKIREGSSE